MRPFKNIFLYCLALIAGFLFLPGCKDDYTERINDQKELDEKAIVEYIADNNIQNAQRQPSGIMSLAFSPFCMSIKPSFKPGITPLAPTTKLLG